MAMVKEEITDHQRQRVISSLIKVRAAMSEVKGAVYNLSLQLDELSSAIHKYMDEGEEK